MTEPVTIIVLSYNTRDLTLNALERFALDAQDEGWLVILVDNGSNDGTVDAVQQFFPSVNMIRSVTNRGYAAGNNLGLRHAVGHTIILLNSDVQSTIEQLKALVAYIDGHPDVGAVSAGLRLPTGSPQAFAFGSEPTPCYLFCRGLRRFLGLAPLHDWSVTEPLDVDWVSGACLALRKSVLDQVGPLDERFFLYFEDVDWCIRMREAGWRVVYQPEISVIHIGGASEPGRPAANKCYYDSLAAFYRKHYGIFYATLVRLLSAIYWRLQYARRR